MLLEHRSILGRAHRSLTAPRSLLSSGATRPVFGSSAANLAPASGTRRGTLRHCFVGTPTETESEAVETMEAKRTNGVNGTGATQVVLWKATISAGSPLLGDTGAGLEICVIDLETDQRSAAVDIDTWRPPVLDPSGDGTKGWKREGPIGLPANFRTPGAVLIRKRPAADGGSSVDYIGHIKLVSADQVYHIPAHSWVSSEHGWRCFFEGKAYLPSDTPPTLKDERARELSELRGDEVTRLQERKPADRIYWYQIYDDLSSKGLGRPALGNSKKFPYPRRTATNRGTIPGTDRENPPAKGEKMWLPFDEQFSFDKSADFNGDALTAALPAAFAFIAEAGEQKNLTFLNLVPTAIRALLGGIFKKEPPAASFEDFADALAMFKEDADNSNSSLEPKNLYPANQPRGFGAPSSGAARGFKTASGGWDFRLDANKASELNTDIAKERVGPVFDSATGAPTPEVRRGKATEGMPPQPGVPSVIARLGDAVWKRVQGDSNNINDLLYFPVPKVLDGRPDAWYTDEEYGRQMLAGFHPCAITALKVLPETFGSAIRPSHVNSELQGATMEALVAEAAAGGKPRLYVIDHWALSAFWDEMEAENEAIIKAGGKPKMVQHAGRAIFYLRKDDAGRDVALLPVAFEIASPHLHKQSSGLPATAGVVYTRSELVSGGTVATLGVWRLAKAVFRSMDSSIHQLHAHFTRTHGAMEPFHIAMRRQLSFMHPVMKLMLPHFRYTLSINRNARSSLINAGGIIEKTFSAGSFAMRLAAAVYGQSWTFAGQALPTDLKDRGMVNDKNEPWMDYPFAEDGLQLWGGLNTYFDEYLRLYYKNDQAVLGDVELQAWWKEVKEEGHGDLVKFGIRTEAEVWGFAGPIPSVDKLRHVLATIAYTASAHHAAVNFGQYDFTSLILNSSSCVRRPMPVPGDKAYEELVKAVPGSPQEKVIMSYLADPFSAVQVLATVKLLSAHARDEQTLDEVNEYLTDPAARAANRNFIHEMKKLEAKIETRNADPANWARYGLVPGTASPLAYTLLMPSSGTGVTMRGVPYSVSI